jgi:hypothetical protein
MQFNVFGDCSLTQPYNSKNGGFTEGIEGENGFASDILLIDSTTGVVKTEFPGLTVSLASRISCTPQVGEMMTIFLALIAIRCCWFQKYPEALPINRDYPGDKVRSIFVHTDNSHLVDTLISLSTCCPWMTIILWYTIREIEWFQDGGINIQFFQMKRHLPPMRAVDKRAKFMREKIQKGFAFNQFIAPEIFLNFSFACEQILMVSRIVHDMMWSGVTHREGTPNVMWLWKPQNPQAHYGLPDFRIRGTLFNNLDIPSNFFTFRENAIFQIRKHPHQTILNIPCRYPSVQWHVP